MGVGICILITDGYKRLSRLCRRMEQGVPSYIRYYPTENDIRIINGHFFQWKPEKIRCSAKFYKPGAI
jgi:hypothetical protein